MKFAKVRDILNEMRWNSDRLHFAVLLVRDRTSKELKLVRGADIKEIRHREFTTEDATIPFYKVESVEVDGYVVWHRPSANKP